MIDDRIMRLTETEKNSQLWQRLKEHLEHLNDKDRRRNDDTALTEDETRTIRARIAARKDLLNLDF